ncbi:sulfite reductase flavoprotein subunit alpha [Catenovulum sp. SM1970]|uniref:diflavin oxidoreductase n=1 Tax=Marinifaba aquimaris TaxID=2741323 RepID=UPI001574056A|nr:sulfite reductase flavoprotein subunit alpha [Marinifaba aquimaris]NTS75767.1 sulfite reductase flavoprotein subunit alpha [Marinifaba aquimaris]
MSDLKVPYLPTDLPFSGDQKQWLGGFLAGLHSRLLVKEEGVNNQASAAAAQVKPLTIIYGSQTGNAQGVAEDAAEQAKEYGLTANVIDMDDAELEQLAASERLLVITSTYGEGEMPDNAQALWDAISEDSAPSFANTFFSVLALGDTNYDEFCLAGILWDERLAALGAQRIANRVDCDVDFEEPASQWLAEALATIAEKGSSAAATNDAPKSASKKAKSKYNRQNPLAAKLITKRLETAADSSKEILHYEFSLAGSGESYEAGDALNVIPVNRPDLVADILTHFGADAEQTEPYQGEAQTLKTIFSELLEIRTPSKDFVQELALRSGDAELVNLVKDDNKAQLNDFLWGKDTLDLLRAFSGAQFTVAEFIGLAKPLAPRAYSISSSIKHHPEEVHLTIGNVRYSNEDRDYNGVCSTFLADIAEVGDSVKCYFAPNKSFAVPSDPMAPMIMVGPGTGIAPFRAFLEERLATDAKGDNWLFFGDRNSATDFIYQSEIEAMQASGLLTRLDLAFSRDQAEKVYVQDKMLANADELFAWLERGGYFFICGDAYRMAKDVDKALHQIIEQSGNMSAEAAADYVNKLKKDKRYVRDVY